MGMEAVGHQAAPLGHTLEQAGVMAEMHQVALAMLAVVVLAVIQEMAVMGVIQPLLLVLVAVAVAVAALQDTAEQGAVAVSAI